MKCPKCGSHNIRVDLLAGLSGNCSYCYMLFCYSWDYPISDMEAPDEKAVLNAALCGHEIRMNNMKTITRVFTLLAVFLLVGIGGTAMAAQMGTVVGTSFAATPIETFNSLFKLLSDGDNVAFDSAFGEAVATGNAITLNKGDSVYFEGSEGFLSGIIKIRLPGKSTIYFTVMEAVKLDS
jgi:hypothetical protein